VHSGLFGGAAPDAVVALIAMLATMHDAAGDTVIPGLATGEWDGADFDEDVYRSSAGMLDGVHLVGTGSLASRLWTKPSATVIGIDVPNVTEASNVLLPEATAKISLRIPPHADADHELEVLMNHMHTVAPWGVEVEVTKVKTGWPFAVDPSGPSLVAARRALEQAYGREVETIGSGGSIPLINSLHKAAPDADVILWGAEDLALARIHASNESVDPSEIERMILAQVLTLQALATSPNALPGLGRAPI
jgi:acetylornithine deacetylase/succinyl-diaminopimelate desuccinylase-like protein